MKDKWSDKLYLSHCCFSCGSGGSGGSGEGVRRTRNRLYKPGTLGREIIIEPEMVVPNEIGFLSKTNTKSMEILQNPWPLVE